MQRKFAPMIVLAFLSGCQSNSASESFHALALTADRSSTSDSCNDGDDSRGIKPSGGKQIAEGIAGDGGQYTFRFRYASYTPPIRPTALVLTCDYNYFNIPVPTGYAADWFGYWGRFGSAQDITFGPGALIAKVSADGWNRKTQHYVYVYVTETGQLLESYKTRGFAATGDELTFASPFENGFVIPGNSTISLEIVHSSQ